MKRKMEYSCWDPDPELSIVTVEDLEKADQQRRDEWDELERAIILSRLLDKIESGELDG